MDIGHSLLLKDVWLKILHYCAYRERCSSEVETKLLNLGCSHEEAAQFLEDLRVENFLNDTRFATTFASGKSRQNKWGRNKIRQQLTQKGLPNEVIAEALNALPKEDYDDTVKSIIVKKLAAIKDTDPYIKSHKAAQHAIGKGYEPDMVWSILKSLRYELPE
jgi:regulatory protein